MSPYESPKAELAQSLSRPNPIWWGYWALTSLALVFGSAMLLLSKDYLSDHKPIAFVSGAIDLVALTGLFFYIRSMPILSKWFWRFVLALAVLKFMGQLSPLL